MSLAAVTAASVVAVEGHHSIQAVYDFSQDAAIQGVVREFQFINPHPFVTIEVKSGAAMDRWRLELDNRSELVDIGMTGDTLRPGDVVNVRGSPGRTEPHNLYVRRLDRPADGFWYEQVGSTPRIRGRSR